MDIKQKALKAHEEWRGKIEIISRCSVNSAEDLSVAYTPGVAEPCLKIQQERDASYKYTRRHNLVAVVTDGSAVLGLGDIGAEAGMPVMEGKCVLFKEFGGVDAFPLCIGTKDVDEIVKTIHNLQGSFGGINLEDISAPRCFEIEQRLKNLCEIPIFHDDQHGTAVVTLAAVINALKIVKKQPKNIKIAISGAGAAGIAIAKLLMNAGAADITICNSSGIINEDSDRLCEAQREVARIINPKKTAGTLAEAMSGADVFIGVSAPGIVTKEMVESMNKGAVVLPMANPVPEIMPDLAYAAGAAVVGTGRSDFDNQINNVLAFPGIFRGALDVRASDINDEMKIAAAKAIADLVGEGELTPQYIIPKPFDKRVCKAVSAAVAAAAKRSGVAKRNASQLII